MLILTVTTFPEGSCADHSVILWGMVLEDIRQCCDVTERHGDEIQQKSGSTLVIGMVIGNIQGIHHAADCPDQSVYD